MDIDQIMRQAQEMQGQMLALQEELGRVEVEGVTGEGLVTFVCTGRKAPLRIKLAEGVFELKDSFVLETLIMDALNKASAAADALLAKRTEEMMESLGLPKDFQLPSN